MQDAQQHRSLVTCLAAHAVAWKLAICAAFCCAALTQITAAVAGAADFKMENEVYADKEEQPYLRSVTIFKGGYVYDYLIDANDQDKIDEVMVFDFAHGRLILLDRRLQLKAELSTKLLKASLESLKTRGDLQDDPLTAFLINPSFDTSVDGETGQLVFDSRWLAYRVLADEAASRQVAEDYRRFADWSARLNAYIHAGARPPFARLLVNAELGSRGELPRRVRLTLKRKQGIFNRDVQRRSEHNFVPRLGDGDRRRIAQTAEDLAVFQPVSFTVYNKKRAEFRKSK